MTKTSKTARDVLGDDLVRSLCDDPATGWISETQLDKLAAAGVLCRPEVKKVQEGEQFMYRLGAPIPDSENVPPRVEVGSLRAGDVVKFHLLGSQSTVGFRKPLREATAELPGHSEIEFIPPYGGMPWTQTMDDNISVFLIARADEKENVHV